MSLDASRFRNLLQPSSPASSVQGAGSWDTGLSLDSTAPAAPAPAAPAAAPADPSAPADTSGFSDTLSLTDTATPTAVAAPAPTVAPAPAPTTNSASGDPRSALAAILQSGVAQGLAGQYQVTALQNSLSGLNPGQIGSVQGLVNAATQPVEQIFILKAFAAGEPWNNLVQYANEMRGQPASQIIAKSTVRGSQDVIQQWQDACATTVVEAAAGEADPRFAWELNKLGNITKIDPTGQEAALAQQQAQWLQAYGGVAVQRGQSGGQGIAMNQILSDMITPITHANYSTVAVDGVGGVAGAINQLAGPLQNGYDVPLRLSWNTPNSGQDTGHFVLAVGIQGQPGSRQIQIHDPWTGTTAWVSEQNIANNSFQPIFGQYARFTHFYQPQPT